VVAMHDITALRAGEDKLREQAAFDNAVLTASPDLIYLLDPADNRVVWSSGNLLEMLGYTNMQVQQLGSAIHATLVHPDDLPGLRAANAASREVDDGQVLAIRYRVRAADGHYQWLSRRATPFHRDTHGHITQLLAVARDVTDVVDVEQRLAEAALHDPLTHLPNRTLLTDRLTLALHRTTRTGTTTAILFCDLDGFKHVNDTGGHAAGDAVLIATAQRLRTILRPHDTVARVGGDEFVILLEPPQHGNDVTGTTPAVSPTTHQDTPNSVTRADATTIATRIEHALREPITIHGIDHVVTVSIGITFAHAGDDPEQALRNADTAMYQAKTHGKNHHEIWLPRT
jgi:PAS domain S-box-containing protein